MRQIAVLPIVVIVLAIAAMLSTSALAQSQEANVAVSYVNQMPDPASAGQIVEFRFKIENFGSKDATGVSFELNTSYPLQPVSGETYVRIIDRLSAFQNGEQALILTYKARIAPDVGQGDREFVLKEGKEQGAVMHAYALNVRGTQHAQILHVDKSTLDPGKETALNFTITNIGNAPLQNLIFSWSESDGVILPVYSDDTKYVKSLDVGKSVVLDYVVIADVNAQAGLYPLDLTLQFDGSNGTQLMETRAGVFVGGQTDFDVTFSESSAGQTSLSVANIGNNPALSVTVRIPSQEGMRVTGSTSSIVGNLDKGDYTIVSFQISSTAAGMRNLSGMRIGNAPGSPAGVPNSSRAINPSDLLVNVEYTDTTGARHIVEKRVPVQFRSASDASTGMDSGAFAGRGAQQGNTTIIVIGALAFIAICAGGFVLWRRRKPKGGARK